MKIYGHYFSSPANQVRYTASALGQDFEYQHVDLQQGDQKTPEYLAINPYGKVPAMVDDGYTLAESNAISRYLACKHDGKLYSRDLKECAKIDQWMDYSSQHIRANGGKILFNKFFAPMIGIEPDEKSMAEGRELLEGNMAVVEQTLGQHAYIAGDNLTIADIGLTAAMDPFEMIEFDTSPYANVNKWRANNMAADWYQNIHARFAAEIEG